MARLSSKAIEGLKVATRGHVLLPADPGLDAGNPSLSEAHRALKRRYGCETNFEPPSGYP